MHSTLTIPHYPLSPNTHISSTIIILCYSVTL
ncbi:hypothetical protein VP277E431_P0157 [Vibrio phage 277E43-1]|nr:hypothetical protein VP277E431_P0157 [Vibrio phage 277E43-1]